MAQLVILCLCMLFALRTATLDDEDRKKRRVSQTITNVRNFRRRVADKNKQIQLLANQVGTGKHGKWAVNIWAVCCMTVTECECLSQIAVAQCSFHEVLFIPTIVGCTVVTDPFSSVRITYVLQVISHSPLARKSVDLARHA